MGRTFASIKDYQVDGNKEMMAIGLMNMAGSCISSYVITAMLYVRQGRRQMDYALCATGEEANLF